MEKAIKKAIEGGYVDTFGPRHYSDFGVWQIATSDPLFWQALGKAEGWNRDEKAIAQLEKDIKAENALYETAIAHPTETEQFYQALDRTRNKISTMYSRLEAYKSNLIWKDYWHRFIDHRAEGKDAESFFNSLLK